VKDDPPKPARKATESTPSALQIQSTGTAGPKVAQQKSQPLAGEPSKPKAQAVSAPVVEPTQLQPPAAVSVPKQAERSSTGDSDWDSDLVVHEDDTTDLTTENLLRAPSSAQITRGRSAEIGRQLVLAHQDGELPLSDGWDDPEPGMTVSDSEGEPGMTVSEPKREPGQRVLADEQFDLSVSDDEPAAKPASPPKTAAAAKAATPPKRPPAVAVVDDFESDVSITLSGPEDEPGHSSKATPGAVDGDSDSDLDISVSLEGPDL
jgi:hypothetical protein